MDVAVQHVYSAESVPWVRDFIVQAHCKPGENPEFCCWHDVATFETGSGFCATCNKTHAVDSMVDILFIGPSCKNMSKEFLQSSSYKDCYTTGSGTSGQTYKHGMIAAMSTTCPAVVFYENVIGVLESAKHPDTGEKQPPPVEAGFCNGFVFCPAPQFQKHVSIYSQGAFLTLETRYLNLSISQVVKRDVDQLGYICEFEKVDTQNYLLRQRRNRVWGTCDLSSGQSMEEYQKNMAATMSSLSSDQLFDFELSFDMDLPEESLKTDRERAKLQEALHEAMLRHASSDVIVDMQTSAGRQPEKAIGVCTCIRPTHAMYSSRLKRHVKPHELCRNQGIWPDDFRNPSAVNEFIRRYPAKAQELAGVPGNIHKPTIAVTPKPLYILFLLFQESQVCQEHAWRTSLRIFRLVSMCWP